MGRCPNLREATDEVQQQPQSYLSYPGTDGDGSYSYASFSQYNPLFTITPSGSTAAALALQLSPNRIPDSSLFLPSKCLKVTEDKEK